MESDPGTVQAARTQPARCKYLAIFEKWRKSNARFPLRLTFSSTFLKPEGPSDNLMGITEIGSALFQAKAGVKDL